MIASAIKKKICSKKKPSAYSAEQIADYIAKYCDHTTICVLINNPRYNKMAIKEALLNVILNEWEKTICCCTPLISDLDRIIQKGVFHEIYLMLSDFENQLKYLSILIYSIAFWFIRYHYDSPYAIIVLIAYALYTLFIVFRF